MSYLPGWQVATTCACGCGKDVTVHRGKPRRFLVGHHRVGTTTLADRLWSKVQKGDGCWLFTGFKGWGGYGNVANDPGATPKMLRAHRASWELTNGPIPVGMHVLHKCDNPPCVRPDHLFLGTHADNMADAGRKGKFRDNWKNTGRGVRL